MNALTPHHPIIDNKVMFVYRAGNTPGAGHESSRTPIAGRTPSRESHNSQLRYTMPMNGMPCEEYHNI